MPKFQIKWNNLDDLNRKIIMAVCFDGSFEKAKKNFKLTEAKLSRRKKLIDQMINEKELVKFKESLRKVLTNKKAFLI